MAKRIAVLGTGANGASISADLIRAGHDVAMIDQWPENVQAMRARGLRIEMPEATLEVQVRAFHLCEVCTFTEQFDIVLLVMKAYEFAVGVPADRAVSQVRWHRCRRPEWDDR